MEQKGFALKIKIELPTRETPGYWKRVKRGAALRDEITKGMTLALCEKITEYALPYITEPVNRDEAREALEDASQDDFEKILKALISGKDDGGGKDTSLPPENSTPLENITSPE